MTLVLDIENLVLEATTDRGGQLFAHIRDTFVGRGWVVMGSGSGTVGAAFQNTEQTAGPYDVFAATGTVPWRTGRTPGVDNFFYASGNADSFSHYGAWMRFKEPGASTRELILQRYTLAGSGTFTDGWWIGWFSQDGFTNGNADKDTPPTSPGVSAQIFAQNEWFDTTPGTATIIANMLISDTAKAQGVWPFVLMFRDRTTPSSAGALVYESLLDTEAGDTQPWAIQMGPSTVVQNLPTTSSTANGGWWIRKQTTLAMEAVSHGGYYVFAGGNMPGLAWASNPIQDSKHRSLPVLIGDNSEGWKGRFEHLIWNPVNRDYPSVVFKATSNARLFWGQFLVPWKINTDPST